MDRIESYGKIDLHLHLDGSLPAETILGLARKDHIELAADTEEGLRPYLTARVDCEDLNEYLRCFDIPLMVLQTAENLRIASCELGRDLEEKGLSYAEVRFAPQLHVLRGLTQEEAVQAVLDGFGQVMEERRGRIRLKAILCCMRGKNCTANMETVLTAARFLGKGVVAADLAGAEGLYPTRDYREEFALARRLGVPFTIHAGEADGPESIWKALEFGAVRIGHGVRAVEDEALMRELAQRGIPLEMCPTSNLQTRAVKSLTDYPLRNFLDRGIRVTVNSDNMTVSDTWAGKEFALLSREYGLTEEEAVKLLKNAKEAAFEM
ncbi:adenosine deaminase [Lachnospiraceae bacterium 62-26]